MEISLPKPEEIEDKTRFKIFLDECNYWLDYFGLKRWVMTFETSDDYSGDWDTDSLAMLKWNLEAHRATVWLNSDLPEVEISDFQIRRAAFHEIAELLLAPLATLAERRFVSAGQLEQETHGIVRTLENTIFPRNYANRVSKDIQSEYALEEKDTPKSEEG